MRKANERTTSWRTWPPLICNLAICHSQYVLPSGHRYIFCLQEMGLGYGLGLGMRNRKLKVKSCDRALASMSPSIRFKLV